MKKGFTLTELLVALTILGGLIAILVPIINRLMPNENMLRAKKAFHVAVVTMQQMLNDQACYPDISKLDPKEYPNYFDNPTSESPQPKFIGLYDPYKYTDCKPWQETEDDYGEDGKIVIADENINEEASKKFANVFMDKIGCFDDYTVDATTNANIYNDIYKRDADKSYICKTKDGMEWKFDYTAGDEEHPHTRVYVDTNGTDKPNRKQREIKNPVDGPIWFRDFKYKTDPESEEIGADYSVDVDAADGNQSYDTFRIDINLKTGEITIQDNWAIEAVKTEAEFMK